MGRGWEEGCLHLLLGAWADPVPGVSVIRGASSIPHRLIRLKVLSRQSTELSPAACKDDPVPKSISQFALTLLLSWDQEWVSWPVLGFVGASH